jgi:hypothetical protein
MDSEELTRALERATSEHERRLLLAMESLRRRLTDALAGLPLREGVLFDLDAALALRTQIDGLVRDEYLSVIDDIIREYPDAVALTQEFMEQFADFRVPQSVIGQLQQFSFTGHEALADDFAEALYQQVYNNTLAGTPFSASLDELNSLLTSDLQRYSGTMLHDALFEFSASLVAASAAEAGITKFRYEGDTIETTRPFCERHVGNEYTTDEIYEIWDDNWAGKRSGDPFRVRGGYNCRHWWVPIPE